jgi:hypothetical protein
MHAEYAKSLATGILVPSTIAAGQLVSCPAEYLIMFGCTKVGRTPSSERDPLVALFCSLSALTRDRSARKPGRVRRSALPHPLVEFLNVPQHSLLQSIRKLDEPTAL